MIYNIYKSFSLSQVIWYVQSNINLNSIECGSRKELKFSKWKVRSLRIVEILYSKFINSFFCLELYIFIIIKEWVLKYERKKKIKMTKLRIHENRAVKRSNCFHKNGHNVKCSTSNTPFMIIFACIQIVLSQIPNFHNLSWLSILAAVMSFSYASIGIGLSIAKVAGK